MKKIIKLSLSGIIMALVFSLSLIPAFATEGVTVNGQATQVGETVTYTLSISDAQQRVVGLDCVFFYDQDVLKLTDVNVDNIGSNTVVNDNQNNNGTVIMNNSFIENGKGLVCKDKTELTTLTFEVVGSGDAEITYTMRYLYDIETVNIYDYTLTYDLSVGDAPVIENQPPVLADEEDFEQIPDLENFDRGDFENNVEGTGSGIKPTASPNAGNNNANGDSSGTDGTPDEPSKGVIFAIAAGGIIVILIAVLVVVKLTNDKKNSK